MNLDNRINSSNKRISKYLDPKILATISSMEIRARTIVEGSIEGLHKSPFKGFNVEFSEYRSYVAGDPIKDIDWKLYAKTDKYYVKEHEEETNLSGYIVLDCSGSMAYKGSSEFSKIDYSATLAASLAFLMLKQQDTVGLVTFAKGIKKVIRPKTGMSHLKNICIELENTKAEGITDIGDALNKVAETMKKRGIIIIFSDLLDNSEAIINKAKQLKSRKHEVVLFHVLDKDELTFPFDDIMLFRDLEDKSEITTDAIALKQEYISRMQSFIQTYQTALRKAGIDYLLVDTSRPFELALKQFFLRRQSIITGYKSL